VRLAAAALPVVTVAAAAATALGTGGAGPGPAGDTVAQSALPGRASEGSGSETTARAGDSVTPRAHPPVQALRAGR
jgi:hypothetical protein